MMPALVLFRWLHKRHMLIHMLIQNVLGFKNLFEEDI